LASLPCQDDDTGCGHVTNLVSQLLICLSKQEMLQSYKKATHVTSKFPLKISLVTSIFIMSGNLDNLSFTFHMSPFLILNAKY
jgi:hypothetical protein